MLPNLQEEKGMVFLPLAGFCRLVVWALDSVSSLQTLSFYFFFKPTLLRDDKCQPSLGHSPHVIHQTMTPARAAESPLGAGSPQSAVMNGRLQTQILKDKLLKRFKK